MQKYKDAREVGKKWDMVQKHRALYLDHLHSLQNAGNISFKSITDDYVVKVLKICQSSKTIAKSYTQKNFFVC